MKIRCLRKEISFFPLFGIPFVLVGLAMLSTPFWVRRKALKTVYVITDRRAITFDGGWGTTVRSYPPEKLQNIHRKEKRGDIGDVILDKKVSRDSDGRSRTTYLGFMNIREPKSVEDLLEQLAAKASQTKTE